MSNNLLGLIFSNANAKKIPELTSLRTMGSVPFGGKYRMIDFPLSNMVNSRINNVGILARSHYLSLMDHVGSGSTWDLSKRRSSLTVLPPFGDTHFENMVEAIYGIRDYLYSCEEEYVLMTNSDIVTSINYHPAFQNHLKNKADITIIYKNMTIPDKMENPVIVEMDSSKKVTGLFIKPGSAGVYNLSIDMIIIKKELLNSIVHYGISENKTDLKRLLSDSVSKYNVFGYEHTGYCAIISSIAEYFNINMSLMDKDIRHELFNKENPIYTKIRDDMPCRYGLNSSVRNSLVAQGCVINGEVDNCLLFKGVTIGKGSKVSNSIIMQDTSIEDDVNLSYVIIDKDVQIKSGRALSGYKSYPIYIAKRSVI